MGISHFTGSRPLYFPDTDTRFLPGRGVGGRRRSPIGKDVLVGIVGLLPPASLFRQSLGSLILYGCALPLNESYYRYPISHLTSPLPNYQSHRPRRSVSLPFDCVGTHKIIGEAHSLRRAPQQCLLSIPQLFPPVNSFLQKRFHLPAFLPTFYQALLLFFLLSSHMRNLLNIP